MITREPTLERLAIAQGLMLEPFGISEATLQQALATIREHRVDEARDPEDAEHPEARDRDQREHAAAGQGHLRDGEGLDVVVHPQRHHRVGLGGTERQQPQRQERVRDAEQQHEDAAGQQPGSVPVDDRPVVVAYLMMIVFMFILINLVVDLLYSGLDPRVRLAEQK